MGGCFDIQKNELFRWALQTIWGAPFRIFICDNKLFGCDVCFDSVIARKGAMPFPKVI